VMVMAPPWWGTQTASARSYRAPTAVGETKDRTPSMVLVLSSTGRGGSSFIGELLASYRDDYVYLFEPLSPIREDSCLASAACLSAFLKDRFLCKVDSRVMGRTLGLNCYNKERRVCHERKELNDLKPGEECGGKFPLEDRTNYCIESNNRVVKTIRARLHLVEPLLRDPTIDVKVIHLYRDVRGSFTSKTKVKGLMDYSSTCSKVKLDYMSYQTLKKQYPNSIHQISYDRFTSDIHANLGSLLDSIYGNPSPTESMSEYIQTHTSAKNISGARSRTRDSSLAYQEWRQIISEKKLFLIQNNSVCRDALQLTGYKLFRNLVEVQDFNVSVFV